MSTGNQWPFENPGDPPQQPGMSSGTKVLLIVLVVGGVCAAVCCGVAGFFFYRLQQGMQIAQTPAEVTARTQEIAKFAIPDRFQPLIAMKVDLMGFKTSVANYHTVSGGQLMLIEMPVPAQQLPPGAAAKQFQQARPQQPGQEGMHDLNITESDEKERQIRGSKIRVQYAKGTDPASGKAFRQTVLVFPGKTEGTSVMLQVQLPEEDWDDEEIERMLGSIE